ncbi:cell proliferation protein CDC123 [Spizellomyces punctatus DAOM BR117]|uniref:Uncharacterized protein n=1 Tax=Spizellomyces punctatus (strain DAOM BR117) TaxID=645134 RepID=A0A0L0HUK2_SPIPD|nr:hypothetical protein, variant [Spizellomyces punctatus DAOM BR117]XP_016612838.1 cell proliferation protein CDC123 [Spizellomyces punctatus DAOM BR117]KND04798.1 hypothetical protein, variant [Spizellomyces punctatus DAOM BR117]KND04799.1 hypothetical protein SPPG_00501 [Spizellomyces punctatus DAOM BR117]|eukprot:XP_016612837.1 hypothetical protein, variant [Spizellomyces punctatus DAOM BR117]
MPVSTTPPQDFPPTTIQHIQNCSFSSWYDTFAACTLKSRIIPLEEEFIEYLNADGVFLPRGEDAAEEDHWGGSGDESGGEEEIGDDRSPSFPELQRRIEQDIEDLGGAVFPKLNWSSPKDAAWITTGTTLKSTTPSEIFLLLKSSDFVAHDLGHAFEKCENGPTRPEKFELVLKKWYDLLPSMEFRCFVKDGELVGISQRDVVNYYDFLSEAREDLEDSIIEFFEEKIKGRFPDPDYVFDVYINQRNRKVWLLDFNPFSLTTDSLLFQWQEILRHPTSQPPIFRIIESQANATQSPYPAYTTSRLPREAIDLSSGASIEEFAENFRRRLYDAVTED